MSRQLIILTLAFFFLSPASASTSENKTYVVPSPQDEKKSEPTPPPATILNIDGMDTTLKPESSRTRYQYHLLPGDSVTLGLSPVFDTDESELTYWLGLHYVPWMNATYRFQAGLDVHDHIGLLQFALHVLEGRSEQRWYWGGGASMWIDAEDRLSNIVEFENYFVFALLGGEMQISEHQSLRLELSYHQSKDLGLAKALLGYTWHF